MAPFGLFMGLSLLVLATTLFKNPAQNIRLGRMAKDWPTARGVVTSNRRVRQVSRDPLGPPLDFPEVTYEYFALGLRRQGRVLRAGGAWFAKRLGGRGVLDVLSRCPVVKEVVVFFNPRKPGEALLEPGAGRVQ